MTKPFRTIIAEFDAVIRELEAICEHNTLLQNRVGAAMEQFTEQMITIIARLAADKEVRDAHRRATRSTQG